MPDSQPVARRPLARPVVDRAEMETIAQEHADESTYLREEIAALRETNRRLNRRIGELEHALAKTESRRLDWEKERKENEALRTLSDRLDRVALWFGHNTPEHLADEILVLRARLRGEEGCPACHEDHPEGTTCPPHEVRTTGQASVNALMRRLRARAARAEDRLAELEPLARACAEAVEKHDSARIAHEAAIAAASFDGILFPFLLVKEEAAAEKREAVVAYKAALAAAVRIRELLAPEGEEPHA